MTFRRLALVLLALGLCGFTDPAGKFSIDYPPGWTTPVQDATGLQSDAPESAPRAWCRANSNALASIATSTQAELNSEYGVAFDGAVWADVLSVEAAKFTVSESRAHVVDGAIVQEATLTFIPTVFGAEVRGRFAAWIVPGRMVNAACFTPSEHYAGYEAEFQRTISSLRPR